MSVRAAIIAAAVCVCLIVLGLPVFGAARAIASEPASTWLGGLALIDAALLVRTVAVALVIGLLATALAFPAAWSLRRLSAGWAALLIAPLMLPNYLVYAAWGIARGPGTRLGDWLQATASADMWRLVNLVQAVGGLALWAWPIAAIVLFGCVRRVDRETIDALRIERGAVWRKALALLVELRAGIVGAVVVVGFVMIGSAIPLHVAQIETYALVIWREMTERAEQAPLWTASLPLIVFGVGGGVMLGRSLRRADGIGEGVHRDRGVSRWWFAAAGAVWAASTLVPLVIFVVSLREPASVWRRAGALFSRDVLSQSATIALAVAALSLVVTLGVAAASASRSVRMRSLAHWMVGVCIAGALVPGVLIGFGVVSATVLPATGWIGDGIAGVVVAQAARLCVVGALIGLWTAGMEDRALRDARRVDAGDGFRGWWAAVGVVHAPVLIGGALAVAALSLHEIEATAVVAPPGRGTLAQRMLSLLHYLREEELKVASIWLIVVGLGVGFAGAMLALLPRRRLRAIAQAAGAVVLSVVVVACGEAPGGELGALDTQEIIGERGLSTGQFLTPRGIDTDGTHLWVVDKTDRVQCFDAHSAKAVAAWRLETIDRGKPCGITVGPGGLIYVADTHEHRVCVYRTTPEGGERIAVFGEYGRGDGQFIYPTDVAVLPAADGVTPERFYVVEYGGNDRVSVFDAGYEFLFSFGSEGTSAEPDNIQFTRPQSIVCDAVRRELIITDAINHRVGRFTLDGGLIAWIGAPGVQPGKGLGQFAYPYGIALLGNATALVTEFGNHRLQLIDLERGEGVATFGVPGRAAGELATPWAVARIGRRVYVTDSGNHRIQTFDLPGRYASAW